jgi:hypothetical protein
MNKLFVSEALLNLNLDSFKKTKDIKGNYLAYLSGFEWVSLAVCDMLQVAIE